MQFNKYDVLKYASATLLVALGVTTIVYTGMLFYLIYSQGAN